MTTPAPQPAPELLAIQALWHPEAVRNPYPGYERVRALSSGGVLSVPEWNATFMSGHAANSALLRSPAVRSGSMIAQAPGDTEAMRLLKPMMLFHDGAGHARLRGLVQAAFTPRVVAEQRELVRAMLAELLKALPREAETDLVAGLAAPLPARVIMHMLGLHGDDEARFIRWTQSVADLLGGADQSAELMARIETDASEMREYFRGWPTSCGPLPARGC
ncbi:hypothetical protein ACFSC4_12275 [Deinococcus malanensis]|uniref:hypothetical protein n=1 Tax=Deinococcus malanensis TaxID=1706855 RepID=UPI0036293D2E